MNTLPIPVRPGRKVFRWA